jgi:hypothetical protein
VSPRKAALKGGVTTMVELAHDRDRFAGRPLRRTFGASLLTLVLGSGTLVCCVLPAVMVSLGAGAALAGLVTAMPQLVWLSTHKALVFGAAGVMLVVSGLMLRHAARLPCPVDPRAARTCTQLRRWSRWSWIVAAIATATGAWFAFVLPRL